MATSTAMFPSTVSYSQEPLPEALQAPRSVDELIHEASIEYGVSEAVMRTVIGCESHFNPNAVGDHGLSRGLVQIYGPAWPEITDQEALDPEFSTRFLAEKLSEGQGNLWTCYRLKVQ